MFRLSARKIVMFAALCFIGLVAMQVAWMQSAYWGEVALYTKAKKQLELELQSGLSKNEELKAGLKYLLDHYNTARRLDQAHIDWFRLHFMPAIDLSLKKMQLEVNVDGASIVEHRHEGSPASSATTIVSSLTGDPDSVRIAKGGKLCIHCILGLKDPVHDQYNYQVLLFYKDQWPAFVQKLGLLIFGSLVLLVVLGFLFREMIRRYRLEKKLSEAKNDFINNLSHEMQTPVFAIQMANRLIREKTAEPEIAPLTKIIEKEAGQLKQNASRILDLVSLEQAQVEMNKEHTDLRAFIEQKRPTIDLMLRGKGGALQILSHPAPLFCMLDAVHFNNVLVSLTDNAIKYSNGVPLVTIETGEEGNRIYVKFTDNGMGISREYLPFVMDKFFRVPHIKRNGVAGFGLGLSYAKHIVGLHGGEISLSSEEEKGTTVTIFLPKAQPHA